MKPILFFTYVLECIIPAPPSPQKNPTKQNTLISDWLIALLTDVFLLCPSLYRFSSYIWDKNLLFLAVLIFLSFFFLPFSDFSLLLIILVFFLFLFPFSTTLPIPLHFSLLSSGFSFLQLFHLNYHSHLCNNANTIWL